MADEGVTWKSFDENIATVSSNGEFAAVNKGQVIIEGAVEGKAHKVYVRSHQ